MPIISMDCGSISRTSKAVIGTDTELQLEQQLLRIVRHINRRIRPFQKNFSERCGNAETKPLGKFLMVSPSAETSFLCEPSATCCAPSSSGHSIRPIRESVAFEGLSTTTSYPAGMLECSAGHLLGRGFACRGKSKTGNDQEKATYSDSSGIHGGSFPASGVWRETARHDTQEAHLMREG